MRGGSEGNVTLNRLNELELEKYWELLNQELLKQDCTMPAKKGKPLMKKISTLGYELKAIAAGFAVMFGLLMLATFVLYLLGWL